MLENKRFGVTCVLRKKLSVGTMRSRDIFASATRNMSTCQRVGAAEDETKGEVSGSRSSPTIVSQSSAIYFLRLLDSSTGWLHCHNHRCKEGLPFFQMHDTTKRNMVVQLQGRSATGGHTGSPERTSEDRDPSSSAMKRKSTLQCQKSKLAR